MTLFLNFRTASVGGATAKTPYVLEGDGQADPVALKTLGWSIPKDRVQGRDIVFAVHGFNVNYVKGAHTLARLEAGLNLGPRALFVGVLWPGDFWIPAINYPWEASDAARCGANLAAFANANLQSAASLNFVSHSLGGRVVLAAVKALARPAKEVCMAAAAVDDNCLSISQYAAAKANAQHMTVLASKKDLVLRLAYRAGDFLSDIFGDGDSPFRDALGFHGPVPELLPTVEHDQIAPDDGYDHGDYFPPSDMGVNNPKSIRAVGFIGEALKGQTHAWPA